jgi:hypothetical protein
MALSDLARTPGEKRSVKPSTTSLVLDGTLPQVVLLPDAWHEITDEPLM